MKVVFFLILTLVSFCSEADDYCSRVSSKADVERTMIPGDESGYRVSGKGRLYFYSSPNDQCRTKDIFIVPGDLVNAIADYEGFTYIMYFTKSGKDVEGWVRTSHLVATGTGIGPSGD